MAAPHWHFADFWLDPATACLWHGTEAVALPPKVFDVLAYLVTHPDRLVTKAELLDAVWPETAVTDAVVRVAIGTLRKTLGDTARTPRFIATVARRGYRFLAPVTAGDTPETDHAGALAQCAAPIFPRSGTMTSAPNVLLPQEGADPWRCAVCQHLQSHATRFCLVCGAPHVEICGACGQAVTMPATFCSGCGHGLGTLPVTAPAPHAEVTHLQLLPMSGRVALPDPAAEHLLNAGPEPTRLAYIPMALAEKIRLSRAGLAGERKHVTVLCATITDALALIRVLDPEAAQQLLDPALHHMMDAVHRYEGMVHQVLGDGIIALFGAPLAYEDHAVRACYAALAMQAALRDYAAAVRRDHDLVLQSRVGLNSGEVVVRTIRHDLHMAYAAVGQTTHLAARMEQVAPPDTVVLTAATVSLAAGAVRVNPLGPVSVQGLDTPVEVWELRGARGRRRRLHAAHARGLTRFVGRQVELAALHRALEQAEAGQGQVVAVVGEAGVGKSRLVDEFVHAAQIQDWLVLDGVAVSYGQATPYFPVLDLLRRYCHLEEPHDVRTIQARVTEQVRTLDTALQDTIPALLALLDALPADSPFLRLEAPQRRQHTLLALKRLLLRQSQVQPLLLVYEDLHWLDTETQALLDTLIESLPLARLLLLVNYRPDYRHNWGNKTYYTQLRLDPLSPASADIFLRTLLGEDPSLAPLTQLLIQRTEGNPFFLEESVRTLIETGTLVGEPSAYRVAHALPTMPVPTTVQAVLAARIDRLPPEDKRVLQTAAVIGMEVPLALLEAVGDQSKEGLRLGLAHLQAAEFLYEARLFPEVVYTFQHALTQEVAYSGVLHEWRRELHRRIVEALEALAGDRLVEQVDRLAYHALRGQVWAKAVAYCRQAGEKAMAQSAHREALEYFEQALRALPQLPETRDTREQAVDLRLALVWTPTPSGDASRSLAYLREAETLAEALDDPYRLGQVALFLAFHYRLKGAHDQAITAAQRALALATAAGEDVLGALANHYLGVAYWAKGAYPQAIACFGQVVASLDGARRYERFGQWMLPAAQSRNFLAVIHAERGRFAQGFVLGEEGLRIAEAMTHPWSLMFTYWGMGLLCLHQGKVCQALAWLERAMRMCQEADLLRWFPRMAAALGEAYILSGRVTDAVPLLTQALEQGIAAGNAQFEMICTLALGEAQACTGHLDAAHACAVRVLACAHTHQERSTQACALRLLGEIAARREPPEIAQAATHYHQALVLAEALGRRPLQAHCHRGLGTLYATIGREDQAHDELSTAINLYRAMEMTFWLPEAEAALAQVEGR